jgi:hypothetical protein
MNKIINSYYLNPLPNLPPQGKELKVKPFPLGGNGKGGPQNKAEIIDY